MSFQATGLNVFIASPGDLPDERIVVADQINVWNKEHGASQQLVFVPVAWEWAVAAQGLGGQAQINRQQVDKADVVIAMSKAKLGQPTARFESGTAEEIALAEGRGIQVSVLLCQKPAGPGVYNGPEYDRLKSYLEELQTRGLTQSFLNDQDLRNSIDRILWRASRDHLSVTKLELVTPAQETEVSELVDYADDKSGADDIERAWPYILSHVRRHRRTTQLLLKSAVIVGVFNGQLILTMPSEGLARRISEPSNAKLVEAAIRDILGMELEVIGDAKSRSNALQDE